MRRKIQTALDTLSSSRSSSKCQGKALATLEELFAHLILSSGSEHQDQLLAFIQLQETFQSNVPSRILAWLPLQTPCISKISDSNGLRSVDKVDSQTVIAHIIQALSLIQGIALIHKSSKTYLGSKYSIEILLDLLLISRQLQYKPLASSTDLREPPLASAVLDTILCILVDSPAATRVFEEANGVEVVVKLLKRAGIPRDVRMKCLEFLYFYLMDETSQCDSSFSREWLSPSDPPTYPSSPTKHHISHPSDCTTSSFINTSSNLFPIASSSSTSPMPTLAHSPPQSPIRTRQQIFEPRSLAMLRREVDYVPLSPNKCQELALGVRQEGISLTPIKLKGMHGDMKNLGRTSSEDTLIASEGNDGDDDFFQEAEKLRTTSEKREILGHLLGNVDALVEGVERAGIWGLG